MAFNILQRCQASPTFSSSGTSLGSRRVKSLTCRASGSDVQTVDIAIVGGGLGGLAIANGLNSLSGDWRVFESARELRTSTSTIIAQGLNSYNALGALDPEIPKRIWSKGIPPRSKMNYRPPGGEAIVQANLSSPQFSSTIVQWAHVQNALAEPLAAERVQCGHRASGYKEEEDGWVLVHFHDKPPIRARMVIAADGVRSALRACMLPDFAEPRYLGHMNWNALVPMERCELLEHEAPATLLAFKNSTGHAAPWTTHCTVCACGDGMYFWQVRIQSEEMKFTVPWDTKGRPQQQGPPGCKQRVLDHLAQLGWHDVATVVAATQEADIFERPIVDVPPLPRWSSDSGRVILVGDAAHAMHPNPGQGSRHAFEDADQLVQAIKAHWPDTHKIAQQYEAMRGPRVSRVVKFAAEIAAVPGISEMPDLTAEQHKARDFQFYAWVNQYPNNMFGDPDSEYWKPLVPNPPPPPTPPVATAAGV